MPVTARYCARLRAAARLVPAIILVLAAGLSPLAALAQGAGDSKPAVEPVAATQGVPPAAAFASLSAMSQPQLSPSGRYLAMVRRQEGMTYLVVFDLQNRSDIKARNLGDATVSGLDWIGDDRLVYSAGAREREYVFRLRGVVLTGAPRLFTIDRDLTEEVVFFDKEARTSVFLPQGVNVIPGDLDHIVVPVKVRDDLDLIRANVRTGEWSTLAEGSERTVAWFLDRAGKPAIRFDTNQRGSEIIIMTPEERSSGRYRWREASRVRVDHDTQNSPEFSPLAPGPSPELQYVLARPNGADRIGLHLFNIDAQTYEKEVFVHPQVDVSGALFDPQTGEYAGAAFWKDYLDVSFVDQKMQAHYDAMKAYFGSEANVTLADRSDDRRYWLLQVSGPRDPGSWHLYDMQEADAVELGQRLPGLGAHNLGPLQVIDYKARDGLALSGYLTLPPNLPQGAKPPLVLYPHGGPEARDMAGFHPVAQFLAARGYAVFQPNFRGSAGFGVAFASSGRRQWGRAMQTDVIDGLAHLVSQGLVDGDRACIMGESYGSYVTLMGVAQNPELFRCAIAASGPSDLVRMVQWERREEGRDSLVYRYWVGHIGDPGRDGSEMKFYSPVELADRIVDPVLLGHGKADPIVPFEQSEIMERALRQAGKQVRLVSYEKAGHGFGGADFVDWLENIERFLAENLAAPASSN